METTSLPSNITIDNVSKKYNNCAGKGCKNYGINPLKIVFIHKTGWFCNSCTQTLKKLELVEAIE